MVITSNCLPFIFEMILEILEQGYLQADRGIRCSFPDKRLPVTVVDI